MSIGVKSENSTILIGSANIVADVGFHLTGSRLEIDDYKFIGVDTPDVSKVIEKLNLPANTPPEMIAEAVQLVRAHGSADPLDGCALRAWLKSQGFDYAYWSQLVLQFAGYLPT